MTSRLHIFLHQIMDPLEKALAAVGWGFAEVCGAFMILSIAFGISLFIIIRKAGYGSAWGVLMLVPIVNFLFSLVLAFREWPLQRQVNRMDISQIYRGLLSGMDLMTETDETPARKDLKQAAQFNRW